MAGAYEKLRTQMVGSDPMSAELGISAFMAQGMAGWMKVGSWKKLIETQNAAEGLEQEEVMPTTQLQSEVVMIMANMALNQTQQRSSA